MHLSVIVPIYNEEKTLKKNILQYSDYLKAQKYSSEIILLNDGSNDNSAEIANELSQNHQKIKFINHKKNRGKGAVVCEGLLVAKGNYRLFIDADAATPINHIDKIWKPFDEKAQIVIGSRNKRDAKGAKQIKKQILIKRILGICGNRLIQIFSVKNIYDTQCGFKAFTKEAVEKIISKVTINRWGFDIEILTIAQSYNLDIKTIPVIWKNSEQSRVGIKGYFSTLLDLAKIKLNSMGNKY